MLVRHLGEQAYAPIFAAMQGFTQTRTPDTTDELWLLQHPPVYTQGQAGKPEHLLAATEIPVVQIDRGGQITYHGPGQLVAYVLADLRRLNTSVRPLVRALEQAVISVLAEYGIEAAGREDAPGVYVGAAKIASLGLRIRQGCCYHGLALNVDMDLSPFAWINPCGYAGLTVTSMRELGVLEPISRVESLLAEALAAHIWGAQVQQEFTHQVWPGTPK